MSKSKSPNTCCPSLSPVVLNVVHDCGNLRLSVFLSLPTSSEPNNVLDDVCYGKADEASMLSELACLIEYTPAKRFAKARSGLSETSSFIPYCGCGDKDDSDSRCCVSEDLLFVEFGRKVLTTFSRRYWSCLPLRFRLK